MSRTRRATPAQTNMFAVNHLEQCVAVFAGYSWGLLEHVRACGFGEYLSGIVVTPRYAARCKRDLALDTAGCSPWRESREDTPLWDALYELSP